MSGGKPKRFIVFAGETYYPCGGWSDFHSSWDTEAEALAAAKTHARDSYRWAHFVDIEKPGTRHQVKDV